MNDTDIYELLDKVSKQEMCIDDAVLKLRKEPFEDMGYAKIDTHRGIRQGYAEVIYGEGKSAEQIVGICDKMLEVEEKRILITRLSKEKAGIMHK